MIYGFVIDVDAQTRSIGDLDIAVFDGQYSRSSDQRVEWRPGFGRWNRRRGIDDFLHST